MAIPDDDVIQRELLSLLASAPDGRLHVRKAYAELAKQHPELTHEEKIEKYKNSVSKWANRVQFARLHLVNRGLIYRAGAGPNPAHAEWIITDTGREKTQFYEGRRTKRLSAFFERNPNLRAAAIIHHGQTCKVCNFNFKATYGEHGEGYIEVHHLIPVSTLSEETIVDPVTEMTVLCSNCHRMIHKKRDLPLSLQELQQLFGQTSQA